MTIRTLNVDQANGENEFVDFLINPEEKEMIITGPGGTGKSFLVSQLITKSMEIYRQNCRLMGFEPDYEQTALTALTNKAAQSLSDATGLDVTTLQSFLCLRVENDYSNGKTKLKRLPTWDIKVRMIVFVDEAYMIDSSLLDELRQATQACKIVFIGDEFQLDPVEASESPIAKLKVRTARLTINERSSKNPDGTPAPPYLLELNHQLRENVRLQVEASKTGVPAPWPEIQIHPGYVDHFSQDQLQHYLDNDCLVPDGKKLIMAFTNNRVNDYNNYLRGIRGQSLLLEKGENLISNDMFERGKFRIKNESTVHIYDAEPDVDYIEIGGIRFPTQHVYVTPDKLMRIPIVLDREHHQESIRYFRRQAKTHGGSWHNYFDLKDTFADLRPRDAATVHKAQGSTKDVAIVDLANIGACNFPLMVARMLYVAASRARYRVIFVGQLPPKYGRLIF